MGNLTLLKSSTKIVHLINLILGTEKVVFDFSANFLKMLTNISFFCCWHLGWKNFLLLNWNFILFVWDIFSYKNVSIDFQNKNEKCPKEKTSSEKSEKFEKSKLSGKKCFRIVLWNGTKPWQNFALYFFNWKFVLRI